MDFSQSIQTSSELNHRTFDADESWNSLQSTILAGNRLSNANDLSDIIEECNSSEATGNSLINESDRLNTNLDALEDEFFDCPEYTSPKPKPQPDDIFDTAMTEDIYNLKTIKKTNAPILTLTIPSMHNATDDNNSNIERTGSLLLAELEDLVTYNSHLTTNNSTKFSDMISVPSSSGYDTNIDKDTALTCSSNSEISNFENNDRNFVTSREVRSKNLTSSIKSSNKENSRKKSLDDQEPCKVARMKKFFENYSSSSNDQIRNVKPKQPRDQMFVNRSNVKNKFCNVKAKVQSFRIQSKVRKSPVSIDVIKRRRSKSSCTDISTTSTGEVSLSNKKLNSSHEDSSKDSPIILKQTNEKRMKNEGKLLAASTSAVSKITKRRSIGINKSMVKPVHELRKIFSPNIPKKKIVVPKIIISSSGK